ncbi:hypothetical protein SNEBB_005234, partial [Seison nebaliae]
MYLTVSRDQSMKVMLNKMSDADNYNLETIPKFSTHIEGNQLVFNETLQSNLLMLIDNNSKLLKEYDVHRGEVTSQINFNNQKLTNAVIIRKGIIYVEIERKIGCLIQKNFTEIPRQIGEVVECNIEFDLEMDKIEIRSNLNRNQIDSENNECKSFWKIIDFEILLKETFLIEDKETGNYFQLQRESSKIWNLQEINENFSKKKLITIDIKLRALTAMISENSKTLLIIFEKKLVNYSISLSIIKYEIKIPTNNIIQMEFVRKSTDILLLDDKGNLQIISNDGKFRVAQIFKKKNIVRIGTCRKFNTFVILTNKSELFLIKSEDGKYNCEMNLSLQFNSINPIINEMHLMKENTLEEQLRNYEYKFLFEISDDGNYLYTIINNSHLFIVRLRSIPFPSEEEKKEIERRGKPINVVTKEQYVPRVIAATEIFDEALSAKLVNNIMVVVTCKNRSIYSYLRIDPQQSTDQQYQVELSTFHKNKTLKRINDLQNETKIAYVQCLDNKLNRYKFYESDKEAAEHFAYLTKLKRVLEIMDPKFYSLKIPKNFHDFTSFEEMTLDELVAGKINEFKEGENIEDFLQNLNESIMNEIVEGRLEKKFGKEKDEDKQLIAYNDILSTYMSKLHSHDMASESSEEEDSNDNFNNTSIVHTVLHKRLEFFQEKHNDIEYSDQNMKHFDKYEDETTSNYGSRLSKFLDKLEEKYKDEFPEDAVNENPEKNFDINSEELSEKLNNFHYRSNNAIDDFNSLKYIVHENPKMSKAWRFPGVSLLSSLFFMYMRAEKEKFYSIIGNFSTDRLSNQLLIQAINIPGNKLMNGFVHAHIDYLIKQEKVSLKLYRIQYWLIPNLILPFQENSACVQFALYVQEKKLDFQKYSTGRIGRLPIQILNSSEFHLLKLLNKFYLNLGYQQNKYYCSKEKHSEVSSHTYGNYLIEWNSTLSIMEEFMSMMKKVQLKDISLHIV